MSSQTLKDKRSADVGLIFNIQKFSLHDGAGIRTLVFLKGCPLLCTWCSNPEGQCFVPELAYNRNKCIGVQECDRCRAVCEINAITYAADGKVDINRGLCNDCGTCVDACPSKALTLFGEYITVSDVIRIVEEDSSFYARSGGGLTLSGGEPISQPEFSANVLSTARSRGLDTAVETTGFCDWDAVRNVCAHANQVFFDIKSMDSEKHRAGTGVGNELILENLVKLRNEFRKLRITVRTPVIPGFNDSREDIAAVAEFLSRLPFPVQYELLPYHGFGEPKYQQLGRKYLLGDVKPPSQECMATLRRVVITEMNLTRAEA